MSMIVCPEPPAAKAGKDVFVKGGNAVDAAVSAAFVQGVTNPLLCGLGGIGIMYYYDAKKRKGTVLDCGGSIGSRPVPESWAKEYEGRNETYGRYIIKSRANDIGYQSVMTPGFVRGCWVAHQKFGSDRLTWAELLSPAIKIAKEGFEIYPYIASHWRAKGHEGHSDFIAKLKITPDAARFYLKPDGSVYEEGDTLVQPVLSKTIQQLAEAGGEDLYTGEIAGVIHEDFTKHHGLFSAEDLRNYQVIEDQPLRGRYRGLEVTSTPVSAGFNIIQMLQILDHFDLRQLGHNSPEYIDLFSRVQRATFIDFVRVKCTSREEARQLEEEITSLERAKYWADLIKNGDRVESHGGVLESGTTHLTCVDSDHNILTFSHSLGGLAGSGVITPGLGFFYNNMIAHFNPLPGHSDSIVPGKSFGFGMPTIVFKEDEPYMATGAPGGSRIFTSIAQSIVNVIDHGMDMRTAVSVPRFHSEEQQRVFLEPAFPENVSKSLQTMGNEVKRSTYMSRVQSILLRPDTGELEAGPDPRGGAGVGRYP